MAHSTLLACFVLLAADPPAELPDPDPVPETPVASDVAEAPEGSDVAPTLDSTNLEPAQVDDASGDPEPNSSAANSEEPPPAAPPEDEPPTETDSILLLELETKGVTRDEADLITQSIADLLHAGTELRIITVDEVAALATLLRDAFQTGQAVDPNTLAEAAKARRTLGGRMERTGDRFRIALKLTGRGPAATVDAQVDGLDAIPDVLPKMLQELLDLDDAPSLDTVTFSLGEDRQISLAVFDLQARGVPAEQTAELAQVLTVALKEIEGASVISRADIQAMLELAAVKVKLDCADSECLAEIGGALGVDKLVTGSIGKLGGRYVVSLRLLDVNGVSVDNRVSESFKGVPEQLLGAVRTAGRKLLGVHSDDGGTVAVATTEGEATVLVDDEPRGVAPLPPIAILTAGRHTVTVRKDGFYDWQSDVYIEPGDTTALWVDLEEIPLPWYRTWWFWTAAGAVVAGVTTGLVVYAATGSGSLNGSVYPTSSP